MVMSRIMDPANRTRAAYPALALLLAATCGSVTVAHALPQGSADHPAGEVVVNLAAGRLIIAVVKDAILIATIENPIEPETHPPVPVPMDTSRVGIVLGAVDWFSPTSQQSIARLDQELPHLRSVQVAVTPHLGQAQGGDEAKDIETTGLGLMERLDQIAKNLHGKVSLPANEPLAELVIADYLGGYGPEVWQLSYGMKQEEEKQGYWETRVLRPVYLQFWPPEKGQPHTLVEFNYPPGNPPPGLVDLLRRGDPRLEKIRNSGPKMAEVAGGLLNGESDKVVAGDAAQFLRAAVAAIAPSARQTMAVIGATTGFAWVLPPPAEPERPKLATQPNQSQQVEPVDRPSLLKH